MLNERVRGWLFFEPNHTNLSFVPDNSSDDGVGLPWRKLLDKDRFNDFVESFSPRQTEQSSTRLEGYYIDAPMLQLRTWFED